MSLGKLSLGLVCVYLAICVAATLPHGERDVFRITPTHAAEPQLLQLPTVAEVEAAAKSHATKPAETSAAASQVGGGQVFSAVLIDVEALKTKVDALEQIAVRQQIERLAEAQKATEEKTVREVQCIVVGEAWCESCEQLKRSLRTTLEPCGWSIGSFPHAQFRCMTLDEFGDPELKLLPRVYFVVGGERRETSERDPGRLSHEFVRLMDSSQPVPMASATSLEKSLEQRIETLTERLDRLDAQISTITPKQGGVRGVQHYGVQNYGVQQSNSGCRRGRCN